MGARAAIALFSVCTLALAGQVLAESSTLDVSVGAGSLADGLQSLERQTGIELLFDHDAISGLRSSAVQGKLTPEMALRQLLGDSTLTVRRAESGAWIVERPAAPPLAQPDAVVPEVLVIGQRTQNADIRRFETDVQPYTIVTKEEIVRAHRDDLGDYFASFITSNTQAPGATTNGAVSSQVDLRGLGSTDTLVLIDGRRMPSFPLSESDEFGQPDLNAIPAHAIERIEVLTGTAGGIYGFGALGGVVNVVLDRETRGLDLHLTEGISSRGDAFRQAVEASFGHTSEDGKTDFTLFASHSQSDTLLESQRGFLARDRDFLVQDQALLAASGATMLFSDVPHGNSIAVVSLGGNLVLQPAYGGAALPSTYTFLPSGFSGSAAALAASLSQHAGQADLSLAEGDADSDLGSNPRAGSLFANLRHRFGAGLEAYVDVVALWNTGESNNRSSNGQAFIFPSSPADPFTNAIYAYFPIAGMDAHSSTSETTTRYTAGVEASLPFGWRGTTEVTLGSLRYADSSSGNSPSQPDPFFFGGSSDLPVGPLGNWNAFRQEMSADPSYSFYGSTVHNDFRDYSLRFAGPLGAEEGPATLTVVAERRTEEIPAYTPVQYPASVGGIIAPPTLVPSLSTDTTSLYAELRARPFEKSASIPLVQGLDLQLAVRRDDQHDDFTKEVFSITDEGYGPPAGRPAEVGFVGTAYTVGAKSTPWPWLLLRASYATGEQPPSISELNDEAVGTTTLPIGTDPKRGGQSLGADGPYLLTLGGNESLQAVHASTVFFGAVLTPLGVDGPRLAVDYSRILKTGDVETPSTTVILDYYPQLVTRGPLTAADRALGYTVGPVTALDAADLNGANLEVEAFDAHAAWPLPLFGGRLRVYADATYHMKNINTMLFQPVENSGYLDGPLKWRGNGGIDWSTNRLTIGANMQVFGRYLVLQSGLAASFNPLAVLYQGSDHIPSQHYLDLHMSWRLPFSESSPAHDTTVDFGVMDVLGTAPPRQSSLIYVGGGMGPGYSLYGDPRERRFELVLSHHF